MKDILTTIASIEDEKLSLQHTLAQFQKEHGGINVNYSESELKHIEGIKDSISYCEACIKEYKAEHCESDGVTF